MHSYKDKLIGAPARLASLFILFGCTAFPGNDEEDASFKHF